MARRLNGTPLPPSVGEVLISFALTCLFGLCGLPLIFEMRMLVPHLLTKWLPLKHASNAYVIGATALAGLAWLLLFFVLWHRLEMLETNKKRLGLLLKWCALSLLALCLVIGAQNLPAWAG